MSEETETSTKETAPVPAPAAASPIETLRQEIDQIFDAFGRGEWRMPFAQSGPLAKSFGGMRGFGWPSSPAMDLVETDTAFELSVEVPGVDMKDVEITISNGRVRISGEKKEEREREEGDVHLSERSYGSFSRSFRMPDGVDENAIEAVHANGVLKLTLPKSLETPAETKRIDVKPA